MTANCHSPLACPKCGGTSLRENGTLWGTIDIIDGSHYPTEMHYDTWKVEYWECTECDHEWKPVAVEP